MSLICPENYFEINSEDVILILFVDIICQQYYEYGRFVFISIQMKETNLLIFMSLHQTENANFG